MIRVHKGHGAWPKKTKTAAKRLASALRKRGYKVSVLKAGLYGRSRGFKWNTVVTGRKKKRRRR